MERVITIFNQKGGVGKTTVAINLAYGISRRGYRVLLIDLDPQGNSTSGLGVDKNELKTSVYDVFSSGADPKSAIVNVRNDLYLLPSNKKLSSFGFEDNGEDSHSILKKALFELKRDYYYIIIDAPPSLGVLSVNALVASDSILIPVQCEYYALEGLSDLMTTIKGVKNKLNPKLGIQGVLFNMYDKRNNLTKDVSFEVKNYFGDLVYETVIPRNVRLAESPSFGKSIQEYDPMSTGAWAFKRLTKEFLKRSKR